VIDLNLLSGDDRRIKGSIEPASEIRTEERTPDDDCSIRMSQDAIDKEPLNYWLWHNLCRLYAATNNLSGAIHACELGIKKTAINPSPLMELSNLYAAKGDYKAAITTGMRLLDVKPVILLFALKEDPLITPTSPDNKLIISLER
jgi:tetratricopeptide (TPR) repeat protein